MWRARGSQAWNRSARKVYAEAHRPGELLGQLARAGASWLGGGDGEGAGGRGARAACSVQGERGERLDRRATRCGDAWSGGGR